LATGVRLLAWEIRVPSSTTTAARMCVPPTSRASTGRADSGKPRQFGFGGDARQF